MWIRIEQTDDGFLRIERDKKPSEKEKLQWCKDYIKWLLGPEVNRSIDGADLQHLLNIIDEEDEG